MSPPTAGSAHGRSGTGRHGHGPALVLINGFAASGLAWPRTWLRALERRFRVVTFDNRGSGFARYADTPFSIADLADDVAKVMDAAETPGRRCSASRWGA